MNAQWRQYGLELPNRAAWIERADEHLSSLEMPRELCMIIAEYGSSFYLIWPAHGKHKRNEALLGLDSLEPFDYTKKFPIIGKEHFKATLTSHIGKTYIDRLSNGLWHRRLRACGQIVSDDPKTPIGPWSTRLPRDACIIIDCDNDEDMPTPMNSVEECADPLIVTMHEDEAILGKLVFLADEF